MASKYFVPKLTILEDRLVPSSVLDPLFGTGGVAPGWAGTAVNAVLQTDGKIVVAGTTGVGLQTDLFVARFNADGSVDAAFGQGGETVIHAGGNGVEGATGVAMEADGTINVNGQYFDSTAQGVVARFNADGTLADANVMAAVPAPTGSTTLVQADGKTVVIGNSVDPFGKTSFCLVRYETIDEAVATHIVPNAGELAAIQYPVVADPAVTTATVAPQPVPQAIPPAVPVIDVAVPTYTPSAAVTIFTAPVSTQMTPQDEQWLAYYLANLGKQNNDLHLAFTADATSDASVSAHNSCNEFGVDDMAMSLYNKPNIHAENTVTAACHSCLNSLQEL